MKRNIGIMTIIILLVSTGLLGWTFFQRLNLTYNSEGKFFDEGLVTVYHKQSIISYGFLTFVSLALTILIFYITLKGKKKSQV